MLDAKQHNSQHGDTALRGTASLTASVYDRMREDVLSGRLAPDAKLRIGMLRARYGIGSTPLREALTRLAGDGLITHEDQKGFRVAAVSRAEMHELVRTRCWLEEIALRESIANGGADWEEAVVISFHRLTRIARSTQPDAFAPNLDWERDHRAFHLALIGACGSRWLLQYCRQLHDQADRYRRFAAVASFPHRDELAEHTAIKEAVLARDAEAAAQLVRRHYERTAAIIAESIPQPGESPGDRTAA